MRYTIAVLLIILLGGLQGCSKEESQKEAGTGRELAGFVWMESDSPLFTRDAEVWQILTKNLDRAMARGDMPVRMGKPVKLMFLLLMKHQKEGDLSNLGLLPAARAVWHMEGWLPVFQMKLADETAFADFLQQAQDKAKEQWDRADFQGQRFYRSKGPDTEIIWLIHNQQLLVSWFPIGQEAYVLERLLNGEALLSEKEQEAQRNRIKEYKPGQNGTVLAGWLDHQRMSEDMLDEDSVLAQNWRRILEIPDEALTPACREDLQQWVSIWPGTRFRQHEDPVGNRQVEVLLNLSPALAGRLQAMASRFISPFGNKALMQMQLAVDMQQWQVQLQAYLQQDAPRPKGCKWLQPSHRSLEQLARQVRKSAMPGILSTLQGVGLSVDFEGEQLRSDTIRSLAWLKMDQPEQLVQTLSMFEPELAGKSWPADGQARSLQLRQLQQRDLQQPAWLALDEHHLGIALGEGMDQALEKQLKAEEEPAGTLLWMRQDMQRMFALMGDQARAMADLRGVDPLAMKQLDRYSRKVSELEVRLKAEKEGLSLSVEQRAP